MRNAVGMYMSSSSYAIDSALYLLKQQSSLPQEGFGAILNSMKPEDVKAMLERYHRLPPEEQRMLQTVSQSMNDMPENIIGQLRASAHNLFQQHEGNFDQLMQDSRKGPVDLNKIAPLVVWGAVALTGVFVADDVNRSQGAKASLVGNVVTDIGNAAAWAGGKGDEYFGETDYGDVFDYSSNEAGWVDPLTGQRHFVESDPSVWDRVKFGAMTAATSLINPLKPITSMRAGAKLATRLGTKAATKPINVAGSRLAGSTLARQGDEAAQLRRLASDEAAVRSAAEYAPKPMVDPFKGTSLGGLSAREVAEASALREGQRIRQSGLDRLADIRAQEVAAHGPIRGGAGYIAEGMQRLNPQTVRQTLREFGEAGNKGFLSSTRGAAYGAARAFGHTPYGQSWMEENIRDPALALLGGYALSQLPDSDINTTGGYGGAGAFSTGAAGGAAGGFGQGYGMQDLTNVTGNVGARKQIWNPYAYRHDPRAQALEGQDEFSGFGMNKGDNMKIGEQILKEVTERMNDEHLAKAKCPKCGKDCIDKMHCMAKADKKPAHGMVIVIGSKAGPGPSKDGKRQKLDSEKDKKEE